MERKRKNRTVLLPDGTRVPALGQGTWRMGVRPERRTEEIRALQEGIALGMTLIDTAEMYGEGLAEELVGEAIRGTSRQALTIVSKVYPHNAGKKHIVQSCEQSLRRLGTDYLDIYLLHWRGSVPLAETVACMEKMKQDGKIKNWGVSNFDTDDMKELWEVPDGRNCAVNQVLYHLGSRGIEFDLLPWMRERHRPVMAYCPLAQGGALRTGLLENQKVVHAAHKYGATPAQVLLAFLLCQNDVIAIPKAASAAHAQENAVAGEVRLTDQDIKLLSEVYPAPTGKVCLEIQ